MAQTKKVLDKDGLEYLWSKITNLTSDEVHVGDTAPTGEEVLWISPNDQSGVNELDRFYPIGSIYINTTGVNPSTFMGGTWERFGNGRVLVGQDTSDTDFDTLGETGGEKEHTLTIQEIPSHKHYGLLYSDTYNITLNGGNKSAYRLQYTGREQNAGLDDTTAINTGATGGGQSHNNLQPYIVVSMWVRTA